MVFAQKNKARLIVESYSQLLKINFNKVFIIVACLDNVRELIVLTAHKFWLLCQLDIKSMF